MDMGIQFRELDMFNKCTGGTCYKALATRGTIRIVKRFVHGGCDPQFISPVGKIQGRSTHDFLANADASSTQYALCGIPDNGRTGTVDFVGTLFSGYASLSDIQILRQGL